METLLGYYAQFMELSKANPIVASVLGVGLGGTIVMWLRGAPVKLWTFFQNWFSYSIVIDGSNNGSNARLMGDLSTWVANYAIRSLIRKFMLRQWWRDEDSMWKYEPILGLGNHYVWYKNRLVAVHVARRDSQGSEYEKYSYSLRFYTTSRSTIDSFIEEIQHKKNHEVIELYRATLGRWGDPKAIRKRPITTVALNADTRKSVMRTVTDFIGSKEWYYKHSISYKLCMVLEGPSGTGKTSLAKSIAAWLDRNLYTLNLNGVNDDSLLRLFSDVPKGSVILIEDFDTNNAVASRTGGRPTLEALTSQCAEYEFTVTSISKPGDKDPFVTGFTESQSWLTFQMSDTGTLSCVPEGGPLSPITGDLADIIKDFLNASLVSHTEPTVHASKSLTLSGILNALDGVDGLEDIIVILSTNHLGDIDEALLRKGRVDEIFRIGPLEDEAIRGYLLSMYDVVLFDQVTYAPIKGCDLQDLVLAHKDDPQACVAKLKTIKHYEEAAA